MPRRAKNDPKLHTKKGYYYLVFYDPRRKPQRKWVPLRTKNKRIAGEYRVDWSRDWREGRYDPWEDDRYEALAVQQATDRYRAARAADWRPKTAKWREDFFKRFYETLPAGALLRDVTTADLRSFLKGKGVKGKPLAVTTVRTYHAQLRSFFGWALQKRLIESNPMASVKRPKDTRREVEYLTPTEVERVLNSIEAAAEQHRARGQMVTPRDIIWLADVVRFVVGTGLRLGEIVRLRWRDVDLEYGVIHVRNTEEGDTKTGEERTIPLVAMAREVAERQAELAVDLELSPGDTVFQSPLAKRGKPRPLSYDTTSRNFREHRRTAKLSEEISFHSLRKTCGVVLASRGVPLRIIQKVLGHADVRITASTYSEVWQDAVRDEMKRAMEGAFDEVEIVIDPEHV